MLIAFVIVDLLSLDSGLEPDGLREAGLGLRKGERLRPDTPALPGG